jgi:hypothetical protein
MIVAPIQACIAQQLPGSPLRVGVTSNASRACANAVPPGIVEQDAASRLQGAGVIVSDIHNAQVSIDLDCVPLKQTPHEVSFAVHQCLGFSELVSSHDSKPLLANTWRKCESYICATRTCEAQVRTGLSALLDSFLSDFRERSAPPVQTASVVYTPTGVSLAQRVGFYAVYLMLCLTVFLYWQFRKRTC